MVSLMVVVLMVLMELLAHLAAVREEVMYIKL
jgi:hypothetical protein